MLADEVNDEFQKKWTGDWISKCGQHVYWWIQDVNNTFHISLIKNNDRYWKVQEIKVKWTNNQELSMYFDMS